MTAGIAAALWTTAWLAAAPAPAGQAGSTRGKGPAVVLRQRFAPGTYTLVQRNTAQRTVTGAPDADPIVLQTKQNVTAKLTVRRGADAGTTLELTFQAIDVTAPDVRFDSTSTKAPADNRLARLYRPLLKAKYVAVLDKDHHVVRARGLDAVWDAVADKHPRLAPTARKMKEFMGDRRMAQKLLAPGRLLPKKPVALGDTWQTTTTGEMALVGEVTVRCKCRLAELTRSPAGLLATVTFTGELTANGRRATTRPSKTADAAEIRLEQTGRVVLNVATGTVLEHRVEQKGKATSSVTGPKHTKLDLAADIKTTTATKITPIRSPTTP